MPLKHYCSLHGPPHLRGGLEFIAEDKIPWFSYIVVAFVSCMSL